ncbi:MAG: hypothetical protein J7M38_11395 [Armatimonadetes bacterium]|nr:hypothetical protein [Armatimonadota bacterium]
MSEKLRAGQPAPRAGHYEIIARNGRPTGQFRRALQGRPLPPTPRAGQRYEFSGTRRPGRRNGKVRGAER